MSAFTTLTVSRSAALAKLAEVDINDLPLELGTALVYEGVVCEDEWPTVKVEGKQYTEPGHLVMMAPWSDFENETLEKVLDKLLEDSFYNFIVRDDCDSSSGHHQDLPDRFPSVSQEKVWRLNPEARELHDQLCGLGFKTKDILALFATKEG